MKPTDPKKFIHVPESDWEIIREFVENFVDGAPDRSKVAKDACHVMGLMFNAEADSKNP
jgi:hypothetical protein